MHYMLRKKHVKEIDVTQLFKNMLKLSEFNMKKDPFVSPPPPSPSQNEKTIPGLWTIQLLATLHSNLSLQLVGNHTISRGYGKVKGWKWPTFFVITKYCKQFKSINASAICRLFHKLSRKSIRTAQITLKLSTCHNKANFQYILIHRHPPLLYNYLCFTNFSTSTPSPSPPPHFLMQPMNC